MNILRKLFPQSNYKPTNNKMAKKVTKEVKKVERNFIIWPRVMR